jgi:putative membrane-bound dehydrogenase-like protein
MIDLRYLFSAAILVAFSSTGLGAPPTPADKRLVIEQIAAEPDIVTPTGVAVDARGRVWVIENHTHERPSSYKGPPTDRIRIFEDFSADGRARKISTFADGFKHSMGLALGQDGNVFLATRAAIFLLRDAGATGNATSQTVLAKLETSAVYPHNGLSGFAIDALGYVYFGLGENFGQPYRLVGSDGHTLSGGGEGGSIYRMDRDGTGLTRVATGFWNPFHMTFDRWGRLFAVDNDPDARGPCRLLHIVPGGDYGYRFRFGRRGVHPFQSWNGELPGTLPMVAGTAEAPSGIVAYESDNLPIEYRGQLLATSWGDHVIEQFELTERGASFGAKKKIMVRGGEDFRPVGIATAPDGSLVVSDWVDKSYPVHGKGRLWRLRAAESDGHLGPDRTTIAKWDVSDLKSALTSPRRDLRLAAASVLTKRDSNVLWSTLSDGKEPIARIHALWGLAGGSAQDTDKAISLALADKFAPIQAQAALLAMQILPADRLEKVAPALSKLASANASPEVRMLALAALARLGARESGAQNVAVALLGTPDPFLRTAALDVLSKSEAKWLAELNVAADPDFKVSRLLALRRTGTPAAQALLPGALQDIDPGVRRAAIQWIAEEQLSSYAPLIDAAASKLPASREVFEAWVAAKDLLANPGLPKNPNKEPSGDQFVVKVVQDQAQPAALRALALRMLRPDHPGLKLGTLLAFDQSAPVPLQSEAVRALAWRVEDQAQARLRIVAEDEKRDASARAFAVMGLARSSAGNPETRQLLLRLLRVPSLREGALRSLRGSVTAAEAKELEQMQRAATEPGPAGDSLREGLLLALGKALAQGDLPAPTAPRPASVAAWREFLLVGAGQGDAKAGEIVFFHPRGPGCYLCHRIDGRGESIGPDLSHVGAALKRDKLIESVLEPSKEIAPAFVTWLITTRDGKQHVGVLVDESANSTWTIADAQGKRTVVKITDVEDRVAQATSIMPAELYGQMTRGEFLDLIAFLESCR